MRMPLPSPTMAELTFFNWAIEDDEALGERIAAARKLRGVSLQTLADFLGVAKATAGHWETGGRSIKHHDFARLCAALRVSADQLLFNRALWPFAGVDPLKVERLEQQDLDKLEGGLLLLAAQIGLDIASDDRTKPLPNAVSVHIAKHRSAVDRNQTNQTLTHEDGPDPLEIPGAATSTRDREWDEKPKTRTFEPRTGGSSSNTTKGPRQEAPAKTGKGAK